MRKSVCSLACSLVYSLTMSCACGQLIIAHRGASHDAPENTLAAFRLAWQEGADGVECDFHLSSDGRIVCVHDKDTKRTTGKKLVVAKSTYAQLRTLDVGSWKDSKWRGERIPTLEEVLAVVPPGKFLFLELKTGPEIVEPLAKILSIGLLPREQIVIIAFNEKTVAACRKRLPEVKTQLLVSYEEQKGHGKKWTPTADEVVTTLGKIGADALGSEAELEHFNERFVSRLREAGVRQFGVWTVDKPDVARFYQSLDAFSITTNRPKWLREQLARVPTETR